MIRFSNIQHPRAVMTLVALALVLSRCPVLPADDTLWEPLGGPDGGFTLSLEFSSANPQVVYLGCDYYGGIYRSTDGGEEWTFKGLVSEFGTIIDIAVSPQSSDIVLAACIDGLYRTADGGCSWNHVALKDTTVYSVVFDRYHPDIAFAGTLKTDSSPDGYGIYKSTDGGENWFPSGLENYPVISLFSHPESPGTIYAGTGAGVFKSSDSGESWSSPLGPWAAIRSLVVDSLGTIYAGTLHDSADDGTVYRSTDDGASWDTSFALGNTIFCLSLSPGMPEIVYCSAGSYLEGDEGVYRTTDSGRTWLAANDGLVDRMSQAVIVDPGDPTKAWAGADGLGGVYRTTDCGISWIHSAAGLRHTVIQAICFDSAGDMYAASGWGTYRDFPCISRTTDKGDHWEPCAVIPSSKYMMSIWDVAAHPINPGEIYATGMHHLGDAAETGILCRSTDAGRSWGELWNPESLLVTSVLPRENGVILAGVAGVEPDRVYGVYRSVDYGSTWSPTSGWSDGNAVWSITPHPTLSQIVLAATSWGVFMSTDCGGIWDRQMSSPFPVYVILQNDLAPDILYAGAGGPFVQCGGVHKSTNGGVSWNCVGLEQYSILALTGSFGGAADTLYAGTGGIMLQSPGYGIFRSRDSGFSWEPFNEGLESPFVLTSAIDALGDGSIYVGTAGGGIYRLKRFTGIDKGKGIKNEDTAQGKTFFLHQNTPNPFNPITEIKYELRKEAPVTIKIYDIKGSLERILVDEVEKPGEHVISWNGKNEKGGEIPSGVYICVMEAGQFTQKRRMALIK